MIPPHMPTWGEWALIVIALSSVVQRLLTALLWIRTFRWRRRGG